MRLLLGVALAALCTAAGYRFSLKKKRRARYFADLRRFHGEMMSAAAFTKRSVLSVIAAFRADGEFLGTLGKYRESLESGAAFDPCYRELDDAETAAVRDYFSEIGSGDGATQEKLLAYYTEKIERYAARSEEESAQYSALSVKLGFLAGLVLMILVL